MSNFNNKGLRENKVYQSRVMKNHVKQFYKIMGDMEVVSKQLDNTLEYNEDNINEYVKPIYGRDLDSMEKFLILGKLHHATEDNIK